MRVLNLIVTMCLLAATAAFAQTLTWDELSRRPELWPSQCAMKEAIGFEGGVSVKAEQKVNVLAVTAKEVEVETLDGQINFAAAPQETDVLDIAVKNYVALTPKQRELTYPLLVQRKDLWPKYVTLTQNFDLNAGQTMRKGDQVLLMEIQNGQLLVFAEKINTRFNVTPQATDVMAQARVFIEDKFAAGRKFVTDKYGQVGPVIGELEGKLVNSVTGEEQPLDPNNLPRYLVLYRGSSTCPITRQFTPTLVNFYKQMKPHHPEFELIYLMTEDITDTARFARQSGFSWRAVDYENTGAMPIAGAAIDGRLPQLIVMDRAGNILANGIQATAPAALNQLTVLLNKTEK